MERKRENEGIYTPNDELLEGVLVHASIPILINRMICNRRELCEHHGYLNDIGDYLFSVRNFVLKCMKDVSDNAVHIFTMNETWFGERNKRFFDKCNITMYLSIDKNEEVSFSGEGGVKFEKKQKYETEQTNTSNNLISVLEIYVTVNEWNIYDLASQAAVTTAHELTHCYDDVKRKENSAEPLKDKNKKFNYGSAVGLNNFGDIPGNKEKYSKETIDAVEGLGGLLYICYKPEVNAFISEVHAEMKEYNGKLKTLPDAIKLLETTNFWGILKRKEGYVKSLRNIQDSTTKNLLIQSLNSVLKTKRLRTYGDFLKSVNRIWRRISKIYKEKLGKICYDIFMEKNDTEISTYQTPDKCAKK